ncbi:MAG: PQQ-binding-like beta-propeller repeat protein [bacterium]|nr:PQQ-binding-like beta-propeller repeat protein [bacterium]
MKTVTALFPLLCVAFVIVCVAGVLLAGEAFAATPAANERQTATAAETADAILRKIDVSRGLCVVLGDTSCAVPIALAQKSELLIYVQLPEAEEMDAARRRADAARLYGTRIYIEKGTLKRLYLGDNLADAVVVLDEGAAPPEAEVLRVLRPQGKALLGQKVLAKPFPAGVDDWSHPYHGPDNNPQSGDDVARGPYLTQFLGEPRYGPLPQVAVASAGRAFKAFGHIAFKVREEPLLNTLMAFNGYNGTILWQRPLSPEFMIHRNTFIATPSVVYVGDDASCKVIDAATGELKDEIVPPADIAGGTFWKWMALEDGVLYALVGEQEQKDPIVRQRREGHGWPWDPLSKGFNQPENPWGFGKNLLAIDPKTKEILWSHHEDEPMDSRALCMKAGRIFIFRFGSYMAGLNARTGAVLWRKTKENAPEIFGSLGRYLNRQDWRTNWRTTAYLKCSDKAVYFSGPPISKLLAVSAQDGGILWEYPYDNFQLVLRDDGLYGISGQIDNAPSMKFDPLTGKVLAEIKIGRRACTRPTGSVDALFFRAGEGSTRLQAETNQPQLVSPMRAQCHDGVTIANGLLYWWPSVCDCNLTLYGVTCLGPAGDFDFERKAADAERLETGPGSGKEVAALPGSPADWATFRANNIGTVTSEAAIPETVKRLWEYWPKKAEDAGGDARATGVTPTAPTAAGGLVFMSGSDGIVRAIDARSGELNWTAFTGGEVRIPPTIWQGRAFVGSGDGWVYALEAATGRLLWRFRAAPAERRIPVYGSLLSTWPAASGVLVEDETAYAAAGIVNYDGTHVYALDAETGKIKWQNNNSGHLDPEAHSGISVQGHMLLYDGKLCMPGGNAVSPAIYDAMTGACLSSPNLLRQVQNNNVLASTCPRGWELYQIGKGVAVAGKPYYAHPKYKVYDGTVFNKTLVASTGGRDILWANNAKVMCFARVTENRDRRLLDGWGKLGIPGLTPIWERNCEESVALAVSKNAVVVALPSEVIALSLEDGRKLWSQPLPSSPVPWGMAVDREGRVILTLEDGQVVCFG